MARKDHRKDSPLLSFFSLSCETEKLRSSPFERSRTSAKQKLGQDLPQRGTKGRAPPLEKRGTDEIRLFGSLSFSSSSRIPSFCGGPQWWTMRRRRRIPRKRLSALSEGKYEYHHPFALSFEPHPPPAPTFSVHLPPPSLTRLFSSFSKRASERDLSELGTINVCLKFPGSSAAMINASHSTARPSASMKNNLFRLRARILCYAPRNFHPPWNSS